MMTAVARKIQVAEHDNIVICDGDSKEDLENDETNFFSKLFRFK